MSEELTLKQKKFLKVYFETGNGTKAALAAYDTDDTNTAAVISAQNLIKLKPTLVHLMEKKGMDVNWLVTKAYEAGDATKWNDFTGEREADHNIRLKAVEIASKWLGVIDESNKFQFNNIGGAMSLEFIK